MIFAGSAAVLSSFAIWRTELDLGPLWRPALLACLVGVANLAVVKVRVRSAMVVRAWTSTAVLMAIVLAKPAYLTACVAAGVFGAKLIRRVPVFKAAYNAAKDTLCAAAGLAVALALGVVGTADPMRHWFALAIVALTLETVEVLVGLPVLTLASRAGPGQILGALDFKLAALLGKYLVGLLALTVVQFDPGLLPVVVLVALCLHLLYVSRVHARAERTAWQQLAASTEKLTDTELDGVLATGVTQAARLFSADEVEVLLRVGPGAPLLARGDAEGLSFTGDPGAAPPRTFDGESVSTRLLGPDGSAELGEVRLHFRGRVSLTERERHILRSFATALRTGMRNAIAFTEATGLAQRHAQASQYDALTGLANRRRLVAYGDEVLSTGRAGVTALVVVDLNRFKAVNEALGHLGGDRLLAEVSRRLSRCVMPDDLVARLAGNEFAALLVGAPTRAALHGQVRALMAALDAPVELGENRVRVEASVGVALADEPAITMTDLLRRADIAVKQAKRGGTRTVWFSAEAASGGPDAAVLMLGGDLPRAVAEREFVVKFQPIVDLATGQLIGAEALTRWHHPQRGILHPLEFLPAVERSGQLPAFDRAVLSQALDAARGWLAAGVDAPVAVNASPRSVLDPAFPGIVADCLAQYRVAARHLVVELTEMLTPTQLDQVGGVLAELQRMGVRLALDDFGTGSSSLAMLARIPAYELKIDLHFVGAMLTTPEAAAVVRSTVELGRGLGLLVVAEGVEYPAQREALWELGCVAGQGHLFGRPMALDDLLARLSPGTGGVTGRLVEPMHPEAVRDNVVHLPRMRLPLRPTPESLRAASWPGASPPAGTADTEPSVSDVDVAGGEAAAPG